MSSRNILLCLVLKLCLASLSYSVNETLIFKVGKPKCTFVDGDNLYDLSVLSEKDFWLYTETLHVDKSVNGTKQVKHYYFSVCHPLKNVPSECSHPEAGVCAVEETIYVNSSRFIKTLTVNGGIVPINGPEITNSGYLLYTYDKGENVTYRGNQFNYKTTVHFMCDREYNSELGPVVMSSLGSEIFVGWMTKEACPKRKEKENKCSIKYYQSDHKLNLLTLRSLTYYNITGESKIYELNICEKILNGSCSDSLLCEITDPQNPQDLMPASAKTNLMWINDLKNTDAHISLYYIGNNIEVSINFYCDRTALFPKFYLYSYNNSYINFTAKSAAVCEPNIPDCVIRDAFDNVYDLRSLYKEDENWQAIDTRIQKGAFYDINICGPLSRDMWSLCPPGIVGACLSSISSNAAYSLGYVTSHPVVNEDKSITILYTGGDHCKDGNFSRSTRITLTCSDVEHGPTFVEETSSCQYVFEWLTPAACGRHNLWGLNCTVQDPLYGYNFDFKNLRNDMKDYTVSDGINTYSINLCGPLIATCEGKQGVAGICKTDPQGDQITVGEASSELYFNDGTIIMKFLNGSACDSVYQSSRILFMCDHEEDGSSGLHHIGSGECETFFIWRTKHACPPYTIIDCTVIDNNGSLYDLSELTKANMNEEYYSSDGHKKYILNVCRSIIHSKSSRCAYDAGACIMDLKGKNETVNIGRVHKGPYIENGRLKLSYSDGDQCNETYRYYTIIEFICDKEEVYPYPQLIGEENCKFVFEWATPFACPVNSPISFNSTIHGSCTVSSPYTGYVFDLNPLKKQDGYSIYYINQTIVFNVCSNVPKVCSPGSGGCLIKEKAGKNISESIGSVSADLMFDMSFLSLKYSGGIECANGFESSLTINFVCAHDDTQSVPWYLGKDKSSCSHFITFHTPLACEQKVKCLAESYDNEIDLTPLVNKEKNYRINYPDGKSFILLSICQLLRPTDGIFCPPGAAACHVRSSAKDTLSLGHIMSRPQYISENEIQILYTHGSQCITNPSYNITSRITLYCDKAAGKGAPEFVVLTQDCQYQFRWNTSYICKEEPVIDNGLSCQVAYKVAKANVDLSPLYKSEGYVIPYGNRTFKLNVCGSVCNKLGACLTTGESYGKSDHSELKWVYKKLKLTYYSGDKCDGSLSGRKATQIYFECDMNAGFGVPKPDLLMDEFSCIAIFHWKTNLTCLEGIYSTESPRVITTPGSHINITEPPNKVTEIPFRISTDSSAIVPSDTSWINQHTQEGNAAGNSSATTVIAVIGTLGFLCGILVILYRSHTGQRTLNRLKRFFRNTGYSSITRPHSENATLLSSASFTHAFRVDESDDDLLRV